MQVDDVPGINVDIMKAIDTCHDFYGGKRGADNINVDDQLNAALTTLINKKAAVLLAEHKKTGSKEARLEPAFAEYLEDKYSEVFVPIDQEYAIIDGDDITNEENLKNYLRYKSVRIILKDIDFVTNNLGYIGQFIRKFMFGEAVDDTLPIGFIIDAASGKLPIFFINDANVNTYVNALVIADSAGTGENEKNTSNFYNRCTSYIFPNHISPLVAGLATYSLKESLLFSREFIDRIYYQELSQGAFKTNLKSFKLVVEYKIGNGTSSEAEVIFAPGNSQGATINTLSNLISLINIAGTNDGKIKEEICNMKYSSTELDIRPIILHMLLRLSKDNITKFLFDLKRTGDYEQVNSAKIMSLDPIQVGGGVCIQPANLIVSTGDQLCSMYARHEKVPCVYNHFSNNTGFSIDLYKPYQDTTLMTPEKYKKICEDKVKYYTNFIQFLTEVAEPDQIIVLIQEFKTIVPTKIVPSAYAEIDELSRLMNDAFGNLLTENVITPLQYIIAELTAIIQTYNKKIVEVITSYLDPNLKEKEKKLTIVLGIIYKFIEKKANGFELDEWILVEQTKLENLNENNIFNYNFEPYFRLVNLYNDLKSSVNPNQDSKIAVMIDKIEKTKGKRKVSLTELQNQSDVREQKKIQSRINSENDILIGLEKGLLPSGAIGKYKNGLLSKISIIDAELMQIAELINKEYKPFIVNDVDNNKIGRIMVEKYKEYIIENFQGPSAMQEGGETPLYSLSKQPLGKSMKLKSRGRTLMSRAPKSKTPITNTDKRDREILTQEINNLLYIFSERIKSVFDALKSDSLYTSYNENYSEFIGKVYTVSLEAQSSCGISSYFSELIGGKQQVKCNYELMMIEIRTDFNNALAGIMKPREKPEIYAMNVKEILEKHNKTIWLALIDNKTEIEKNTIIEMEALDELLRRADEDVVNDMVLVEEDERPEEDESDTDDTELSDLTNNSSSYAGGERPTNKSTVDRAASKRKKRMLETQRLRTLRQRTKKSLMEINRYDYTLYNFLINYSTYTQIPKDEYLIDREKEKMRERVANTQAALENWDMALEKLLENEEIFRTIKRNTNARLKSRLWKKLSQKKSIFVGGKQTHKYVIKSPKKTYRQRKNKKHSTNKIKRRRKNKYTRKNRN